VMLFPILKPDSHGEIDSCLSMIMPRQAKNRNFCVNFQVVARGDLASSEAVVVDVLPVQVETETGSLRDTHVTLVIQRVRDRA